MTIDYDAHVDAWRAWKRVRPFRFEDLKGRPEPERWGPKYSKPPAKRVRFNDETNIPTNCASGQKGPFSAAKHRAKLKAEFAAAAEAEKRKWAMSQAIRDAYKACPKIRDRKPKPIKPHYLLIGGEFKLAS